MKLSPFVRHVASVVFAVAIFPSGALRASTFTWKGGTGNWSDSPLSMKGVQGDIGKSTSGFLLPRPSAGSRISAKHESKL